MPTPGEPALWMIVDDVFHIKGRGTVITGQLQGDGQLSLGDTLFCDGQNWQVSGIEQFRSMLPSASPGSRIGVLVRGGLPAGMLRGRMVQFGSGAAAGPFGPGEVFGPLTSVTPKKKRRFR